MSYTGIYRDFPVSSIQSPGSNHKWTAKECPKVALLHTPKACFISEAIKMLIRVKLPFLHFFLTSILLEDLKILVMNRDGQKHFEVGGW